MLCPVPTSSTGREIKSVTNSTELTPPPGGAAPAVAEMSASDRFFGVFVSPSSTFASIARKPDFLAPLIALMAVSAAGSELVLRRIGAEELVRRSLEISGRAKAMSPEQVQKALAGGARVVSITAHFSFIGVPIFLIIVAAIGMLILKAGFGIDLRFRGAFGVTAYANLPSFLAGLLGLAVIGFGDPAQLVPTNITPANLGFFIAPGSVSPALYTLATSLNIFTFWCMVLLGIGFSALVARKVRARTIFIGFLAFWVVWTLLRVGAAAI